MSRINFLNIPIDAITMKQTLNSIDNAITLNKQIVHSAINAGKVVVMQTDKNLEKSVLNSDLINADGQSIVLAARFLGEKIPERVTGIDLMQELVKMAKQKGYKCYFLGAEKDVLKKMINTYLNEYSSDIIAGYQHGYYKKEKEEEIVNCIKESRPNILFVGMSSPKKEIFIDKYKDQLRSVSFLMGVGGSFDVIAGYKMRAPKLLQNIGCEWLWRFALEPIRLFKRYTIGTLKFISLVINERMKQI